ncbi:hypothetical protein D3C78_1429650 [compost metagenome]
MREGYLLARSQVFLGCAHGGGHFNLAVALAQDRADILIGTNGDRQGHADGFDSSQVVILTLVIIVEHLLRQLELTAAIVQIGLNTRPVFVDC